MKLRAPITDKIDVRNFNDELKHAIVKRSRVRYMPTPQEDEETMSTESGADAEALAQANEIFERLQKEAEEDEKAKEAEWIAKLSQEQGVSDSDYNATTGSYSGAYGKGNVSDETKDLAASILGEKADGLAALISQNQVD
ncbi:MAG: hypothetical protein E7277_00550 [Lachnospiraceae bacterium]|nr:hypothetical protein [Lachnospiraceae bacterium]